MTATDLADEPATDATFRYDLVARRARELGIKVGRLAQLAGVDRTTLWRYRKGQFQPKTDVARRLADSVGIPFDELSPRGKD